MVFCDDRDRMVEMLNDRIEELRLLEMEPEPGSLVERTYQKEEKETLEVGHSGKKWSMPFVAAFDVLGFRFGRTVKGIQGTEKSLRKGMGSRWRYGYTYRARSVLLKK